MRWLDFMIKQKLICFRLILGYWYGNSNSCLFWIIYDYTLQAQNLFLMAWTSVERNLLAFKSSLFRNRMRRIIYHYIPIIVVSLIPFVFYMGAVLSLPTCDGFLSGVCNGACYENIYWLTIFDFSFNVILPITMIILFNCILIFKVFIQKKRLHLVTSTNKTRRLTLQLLILSILYSFAWLPQIISSLIQNACPDCVTDDVIDVTYYITYIVPFGLPFIIAFILPEVRQFVFSRCPVWIKRRTARVLPFEVATLNTLSRN
ncbi:unnamed protein product [Didymodactylos carnosus]|uniref:G-protein coupled receptors family 1 profile domain-containing protein n=1 Tax=Didymodactylos carnosus TaxID=1234261 RepID=A0A813ZE59_9BILA|nr:unnamed protein product [Didymodactylos carnosus]CAF1386910.1 unnamed protein product [Didymodactylos carnosus]CAF3680245.1 unnamed protein product [Didymodactylos carnosus]CAF4194773.1 unnamed protein product [Didymodactylos carnosus]